LCASHAPRLAIHDRERDAGYVERADGHDVRATIEPSDLQ
jgi:hypothetical protein